MSQNPMTAIQDPDARLDYEWDWGPWLDVGETITTHEISILPPEEMATDGVTATPETVTAWLKGGVRGRTYNVTCHILTSDTREDDRSWNITIKDR